MLQWSSACIFPLLLKVEHHKIFQSYCVIIIIIILCRTRKKLQLWQRINVGVKSVPFSMFCYFFQICMTGNRWTLIKLNVNFYYAPSLLNVTPYRSYHSDLVLSCFTDCFKWFSNTESVNTARFLKYVWPFLNIMKEKVD